MPTSIRADRIRSFLNFVHQRETLRLRKESEQEPWTTDPILAKYRFCNIRRRDDRVSEWLQGIIAEYPNASHLGPWLALARFVNWPPTLRMLLDNGISPAKPISWGLAGKLLDYRCEQGIKTWTGAYMVRAERQAEGKKGRYVCEVALQRCFESKAEALGIAIAEGRREVVHGVLQSAYGWGSFMAGQVVDDWTWTDLLRDATDHFTWAPQGPGSLRGLNWLKGRPLTRKIDIAEWQQDLMLLRERVVADLGNEYHDLTLMDVQNMMCEHSKYCRATEGGSPPRSLYKPECAY